MKFTIVAMFLAILIVDQLKTSEAFTAGRGPGRKRETKVYFEIFFFFVNFILSFSALNDIVL